MVIIYVYAILHINFKAENNLCLVNNKTMNLSKNSYSEYLPNIKKTFAIASNIYSC